MIFKETERYKLLLGNILEQLKTLPDESVDCVMTSPPYWSLRDYGDYSSKIIWGGDKNCNHEWNEIIKKPTGGKGSKNANVGANKNDNANMRDGNRFSDLCNKCGAWRGQLGLEPNFDLFVEHLADVFDEVKRVLKNEGTCFVNIGDTYSGSGAGHKDTGKASYEGYDFRKKPTKTNLEDKSLCNVPARFSIEMQNRGWILRNILIWKKNNAMPSSATDRFTVDFEKIFFFVKKQKYFFETQREPHKIASIKRAARARTSDKLDSNQYSTSYKTENVGYDDLKGKLERGELRGVNSQGRNKRCVWTINTKGFSGAHFAVYPEELCETPLKAGCPKEVCSKCGQAVVEKEVSVGWIDDPKVKEVIFDTSKPYSVQEREGFVELRDLPSLKDISKYLREARKNKGMTIKEVEEIMESQAPHHWFSGESYPTKDDWLVIKEILGFDNTYDKQMTNVKWKPAGKLESRYETIRTSCDCEAELVGGVVLDPFTGSSTTGVVALKQRKRFIGIDINKEYLGISAKRLEETDYFVEDEKKQKGVFDYD